VGTGVIDPTVAATYSTDTSASPHDRLIETAYLANSRRQSTTTATGGSVPLNIPAEIRQVRKEVHSAKPSGRPLEPI